MRVARNASLSLLMDWVLHLLYFVPDPCRKQGTRDGRLQYRSQQSLLLYGEAARWLAKNLTTANLLDRLAACEESSAQ